MTVSIETLEHIKRWEGLRLEAYPDPGSRDGTPWTIGYGHTSDSYFSVYKGQRIDDEKATELLIHDLEEVDLIISSTVKVPLSEGQRGALQSFIFNIGGTAWKRSTALKKLNAGLYDQVPAQLARWNKNDGKVMQGLTNRRNAEIGLWAKGSFVSSNTVVVDKPKSEWLTPENIGLGAGSLVSVLTAVGTSGILQTVLAGVIGVSFLIGAFFFIRGKLQK